MNRIVQALTLTSFGWQKRGKLQPLFKAIFVSSLVGGTIFSPQIIGYVGNVHRFAQLTLGNKLPYGDLTVLPPEVLSGKVSCALPNDGSDFPVINHCATDEVFPEAKNGGGGSPWSEKFTQLQGEHQIHTSNITFLPMEIRPLFNISKRREYDLPRVGLKYVVERTGQQVKVTSVNFAKSSFKAELIDGTGELGQGNSNSALVDLQTGKTVGLLSRMDGLYGPLSYWDAGQYCKAQIPVVSPNPFDHFNAGRLCGREFIFTTPNNDMLKGHS